MRVRSRLDLSPDIPHFAFRIPHSMLRPVVQLNQLFQRLHPSFACPPEQRAQDVRGREGVPEGAMACRILDAEERRHLVEPPAA